MDGYPNNPMFPPYMCGELPSNNDGINEEDMNLAASYETVRAFNGPLTDDYVFPGGSNLMTVSIRKRYYAY